MNESNIEEVGNEGEHYKPEPLFITDMRPTLSERTLNQNLPMHRILPTANDRAWAGPSHWKLKILRNRNNERSTKGNDAVGQKAKKPKFVPQPIDFAKLNSLEDMKKTCLGVDQGRRPLSTVRKTIKESKLMPENLLIDHKFLTNLTTVDNIQVSFFFLNFYKYLIYIISQ